MIKIGRNGCRISKIQMLIAQVWCSKGCFRDPTFWAKGVTRNFGHIWDKVYRLFIGKFGQIFVLHFCPSFHVSRGNFGCWTRFRHFQSVFAKVNFWPLYDTLAIWVYGFGQKSRNPEIPKNYFWRYGFKKVKIWVCLTLKIDHLGVVFVWKWFDLGQLFEFYRYLKSEFGFDTDRPLKISKN